MKYSEVDVLNYVEGRLNDIETAEFVAQLRIDPELVHAVEIMQASLLPIEQAYNKKAIPPVPDSLIKKIDLLTTISERLPMSSGVQTNQPDSLDSASSATIDESMVQTSENQVNWKTSVGLAACLALGVAIGAIATQFNFSQSPGGVSSSAIKHDRLVKRIADYQSLYVENTVAHVSDSSMNNAIALINSVGQDKRQDKQVESNIPDFSELGYEFARAQELGFEGEALVQLVYRKAGVTPLALCFMRDANSESSSLSISKHHGLNAAGWVNNSHHYILVAEESDVVLKKLYDIASQAL